MDYREKVLYLLQKHNQDTDELKASISELKASLAETKREVTTVSRFVEAPQFVDLDLPSGTLWMDRNIGAKKETDYGLYFQFGDTVGYSAKDMKARATWENCPGNGGKSTASITDLSTWDSKYIDNDIDYLKSCVDAAYVHTNGVARIPNYGDCFELTEYTDSEFVTNFNGSNINGFKIMSQEDHSKYIFLPASGRIINRGIDNTQQTSLWSARNYGKDKIRCIAFNPKEIDYALDYRYVGLCIRGVLAQ